MNDKRSTAFQESTNDEVVTHDEQAERSTNHHEFTSEEVKDWDAADSGAQDSSEPAPREKKTPLKPGLMPGGPH